MIIREVLIKNSSDHKVSDIVFENIYEIKPDNPNQPDKPDKLDEPDKPDKPNKAGDQITRPEKPGKNEQSKNVKTGVEEYILSLALIVFILSLLLILTRKRNKVMK